MSEQNGTNKVDATPLYTNPQELENVLFSLTQPDNKSLRKATLLMQDFMEKPESIMPLIQQIQKSQKAAVRQVAAIYLREQIEVFWKKIPAQVKENLMKFLLEKLFIAEEKAERLAIAAATTSTAKLVMSKGEWPALLAALQKACAPEQPVELREVSYTIWRNVVQFCGGSLKKHFGNILPILQSGLKDNSSRKLQVECLKGIGAMVPFLENPQEVKIIESVIPQMVIVIELCLKNGDEDNVIDGMEVFNELIESPVPVLQKHCLQLTQFMLKISSAKGNLPLTVRKQAVNFMTWMCKAKPKTVVKHNFIQPFLTLCVNLIMESDEIESDFEKKPETDRDAGEENKAMETDFVSPLGIACDLMDEIFLNIPSEQCFPMAVTAVKQLLADKEAKKRKSGFVTMAMMAEGCSEIIGKGDNLPILLKASIGGISDTDATVRKCALEAITQFATHLQYDIVKYHGMILPEVFKVFFKPNEDIRVKERALNAVEMFIDTLDESHETDFKIETYLKPIMQAIGSCMQSKNKALQIQAVATMASTASCAKSSFVQYLPQVLSLLEQLLKIEDEKQLELRAEATQCLGAVALAAGRQHYGPHLMKYHTMVMDGLQKYDSACLRESSFMYFSELSGLMKEDLLKLESFEDMFTLLLMTMADDDGLTVELPDDGFGGGVPKTLLGAMADDDDDNAVLDFLEDTKENELDDATLQKMIEEATQADDDEAESDEDEMIAQTVGQMKSVKLNVTTGFMEEKASAIHCLTNMVIHCGHDFLPHINECWEQIQYLWEYPHALVKMAISHCVHALLNTIIQFSLQSVDQNDKVKDSDDEDEWRYKWTQGKGDLKYSAELTKWIDDVFPLYIQAIFDEDDNDSLTMILDNFNHELLMLGPSAIAKHMESLSSAINAFLNEKTASQSNAEVDNDETADIASKHKFVSDCVAELIATLAELWGKDFMPLFDKLFPNLTRWANPKRHPHDQAMCVGCVADVSTRLAASGHTTIMSKYSDKMYQLALRLAQSTETNMRQNALYAIGALFMASDQKSNAAHSENCLRCIHEYLKFPNDGTRAEQLCRDNGLSALGKMIMSEPEKLPVNVLLPEFLKALPLTADFSENIWTVRVVIHFILKETDKIKPMMQPAMTYLAKCITDDEVSNKSKMEISDFFRKVCSDKTMQQFVETQLEKPAQEIIKQCCA